MQPRPEGSPLARSRRPASARRGSSPASAAGASPGIRRRQRRSPGRSPSARSERPTRRLCRSDETRAPDERDPLEASGRCGWRESSKRSSASVGAGAPFRGIALARPEQARESKQSCRAQAGHVWMWAIARATGYSARPRSGRPLFGEALAREGSCGPWRDLGAGDFGFGACFHAIPLAPSIAIGLGACLCRLRLWVRAADFSFSR